MIVCFIDNGVRVWVGLWTGFNFSVSWSASNLEFYCISSRKCSLT